MRRVALPLLLVGALAAVVLTGTPTTAAPLALCRQRRTTTDRAPARHRADDGEPQLQRTSSAAPTRRTRPASPSSAASRPAFFAATHSLGRQLPRPLERAITRRSRPGGCGSSQRACTDLPTTSTSSSTRARSTLGHLHRVDADATARRPAAGATQPRTTSTASGTTRIFFSTAIPTTECDAHDIAVTDLTAQSGRTLVRPPDQTLPAFSFVTPNARQQQAGAATRAHGEQTGDALLQQFLSTVQQSNSYQAGNTLVLITYDEGAGSGDVDAARTAPTRALDLPVTNGVSAHQDSCHIPLFVVYPYTPAGDHDPTFFDHYSITKTVEQLFGLPYLAHAGDAQTESLVGHFGIPAPGPLDVHAAGASAVPPTRSTASGTLSVAGTATSDTPVSAVQVSVDGGTPQPACSRVRAGRSISTRPPSPTASTRSASRRPTRAATPVRPALS